MTAPQLNRSPKSPEPERVDREQPLRVHVLAHTHWDREWYHAAPRFQARLVALIDALLAAPVDPATPFLLDGQAIVLADYLAIRPEREPDIAAALSCGALEAGPWFVLADNLIPSGEAIVRNLEAGARWLRRLHATPPRVAYCPDTFGHPAALPAIASGFGCDVAIVWRGFGGRTFPSVDTAWWYGPDQSRVLLYHLSPDGYELGSALPTDAQHAGIRWRVLAQILQGRATTGDVVLPVGADHHAASPVLTEALAQLTRVARASGASISRGSLSHTAGALLQSATARDATHTPLAAVRGELRDSYGYTWTLPGTLATRAFQKRANAHLERALLRDVEPWLALAWLHAPASMRGISPDGAITLAQLPVLTLRAWETLLQTHPHDTLCGCSVDAVAAEMSARQRQVASVLPELRESALCCALGHDRVASRAHAVAGRPHILVRNRCGRPRAGVAEVRWVQTLANVPVGPRSASVARGLALNDAPIPDDIPFPHQVLSRRVTHARRESPQHYPDNDLVFEHRILAWVPEVPAFGLCSLRSHEVTRHAAPHTVHVHAGDNAVQLSTGELCLTASPAGVVLHLGERRIDQLLRVHTQTDTGDSYTPSLSGQLEPLQLRAIRVGARGPLRGSVKLCWTWRRGGERIRVWTELIVDAGANYVRCDVRGWNERENHRLQLVWATDVAHPRVIADAAFGPVERQPIAGDSDALLQETPPSTMPLHRWLCAHDDTRGVTMLSDGLAEGEVGEHFVAVTLLRAVGALSRDDLPERPGHAGWPGAIPHAQCQGRFAARVGLLLHAPWSDQVLDLVETAADAMLLPLMGESWRDLPDRDVSCAGPQLTGEGLVLSAVHVREDGNGLRLRAVNVTSVATLGRWTLPTTGPWRVRRCRLDGTPLDEWRDCSDDVAFTAAAREIVTIDVTRAQRASAPQR